MKRSQIKSGVIVSYVSQAIHILTALIYTPVLLRLLGKSEYGLYQLVASVSSYLSVLNLGFNSSYIRFFSRYSVNDDREGLAKLNGLYVIIFSVIAFICLLCGIVMARNMVFVFGDKLSRNEIGKARVLLILLVISMAISFMGSVFESQMSAYSKFFPLKMLELLQNVFNPFLTLPLLILGYGSVALVIVSTVLTLVKAIVAFGYSKKILKCSFVFSNPDLSLLREMFVFTVFIFINMVIEQINWNMGKFLIGRIHGTVAVAIYSVGCQMVAIYRQVPGVIRGMFIPKINFLVESNCDKDELNQLFIGLGRIIFMVVFLLLSGFIIFGKAFVALWAGAGYENVYYIALIVMIPLLVPIIQGPGIDIQRAKNKHQVRTIVYFFIAIINIIISVPLIKIYNELGASMGTCFAMVCGQIIFMNFYYHKKLDLDMVKFWKNIAKFFPAVVICFGAGVVIVHLIQITSIIGLLCGMGIYVVIYAVVFWTVGMNVSEKRIIQSILKRR